MAESWAIPPPPTHLPQAGVPFFYERLADGSYRVLPPRTYSSRPPIPVATLSPQGLQRKLRRLSMSVILCTGESQESLSSPHSCWSLD